MNRETSLSRFGDPDKMWDIAIIGGGATGVGIAVDAASRGYSVCLVEQSDFGKGTSSRSTKLVHGGVRYLRQGNISLVTESLEERGMLRQNAPHLVHELAFIIPNYSLWEAAFYGIGMKIYDLLAGKKAFGKSRHLSKEEVLRHIPTLQQNDLRGGVMYYDGQFDDARLLIHLSLTADEQGATLLNYARVVSLSHDDDGLIDGFSFVDVESGETKKVRARAVVNATGAFCDALRQIDDPQAKPMVAPSQGVHVVLDRSFLPGDSAIMVPRTSDGRVMFAIPWHGHTLLGTTDTEVAWATLEPVAMDREIDFLLDTASQYLARAPQRSDILSAFAGIRPLVKATAATHTSALSRDHVISRSKSGLLTITGGKWTTYRRMAEDCVDQAAILAKLEARPCITKTLHLHGYHQHAEQLDELSVYGSDATAIQNLMRDDPQLGQRLHERLSISAVQVVWAVRYEMARTVEDVLSRRTRALVLDARAAIQMAPAVARLLATELNFDSVWESDQVAAFETIAKGYLAWSNGSIENVAVK